MIFKIGEFRPRIVIVEFCQGHVITLAFGLCGLVRQELVLVIVLFVVVFIGRHDAFLEKSFRFFVGSLRLVQGAHRLDHFIRVLPVLHFLSFFICLDKSRFRFAAFRFYFPGIEAQKKLPLGDGLSVFEKLFVTVPAKGLVTFTTWIGLRVPLREILSMRGRSATLYVFTAPVRESAVEDCRIFPASL